MTASKPISPWLILGLIAGLHADWHFARPPEERLSLGWNQHWLFCAALFAVAGWFVRGRWPDRVWPATAWNLGLAVIGAQVVEPVLESVGYLHHMGYEVEPERWTAFWVCLLAGGFGYFLGLRVQAWRSSRREP